MFPNSQNVVATQQTFAVFAKIASLTQTTSRLSRSGPVLEYANIHVFYCPMMHGTMYTEYLSRNEFKVMDRTSDHKIHPTALLFLLKCQIHLQANLHILAIQFLLIFLANHQKNESNLHLKPFENQVQNPMVTQFILHAGQNRTLMFQDLPLASV